ncbi:MAG: endonuclease/exonuclease/phosphatase family protein [Nocardioides sp.]|uniref:endonuclease/exonuclease/phosphatase family protein n=1 Tax=Nocardioides sp. TaxID=35761 RepID=UPI003F05610D
MPRALAVAVVTVLVMSGLWLLGPGRTTQDTGMDALSAVPADIEVPLRKKRMRPSPATEPQVVAMRLDAAAAKQQLLERKVRKRKKAQRLKKLRGTPYSFQIGSFNVLGSQHTAPGGSRKGFQPGGVRIGRAASYVRAHGVEILGTQELQADQLNSLVANTGMKAYPGYAWGEKETDHSILYDPDVFELVSGEAFHVPLMGRTRPFPVIRLRHKLTTRELYVINTHPSSGGGRYAAERQRGHGIVVGLVNKLVATGLPVLVTGDMNDRENFYCSVVARTAMTASNGGGSGCAPPPGPIAVDWVVGAGVSWSSYWRDTRPVEDRTSDHFFISATASVD